MKIDKLIRQDWWIGYNKVGQNKHGFVSSHSHQSQLIKCVTLFLPEKQYLINASPYLEANLNKEKKLKIHNVQGASQANVLHIYKYLYT